MHQKIIGIIKWYNSISFRIPVILTITIIIPMLFFWQYNASTVQKITSENVKNSIQSDLSNKAISLDYVLREVSQFASETSSDKAFIALMRDYFNAPSADKPTRRSILTRDLVQKLGEKPTIESIYIVIEGYDKILSTIATKKEISVYSTEGQEIYQTYLDNYVNKIAWSSTKADGIDGERRLTYYKPLVFKDSDYFPNCSLIINTKASQFSKFVESIAFADGTLVICDFKGNIMLTSGLDNLDGNIVDQTSYKEVFASQGNEGVYTGQIDGQKSMIVFRSSINTGWKFIESVPLATIYGKMQGNPTLPIFLVILGIIVSQFGAMIISRAVINPIRQMLIAMKKMESGEFATIYEIKGNNEMGVMVKGYNKMVDRLNRLIDRIYVQELLRREAQLRIMQSQMDEHFLYNILNTVNGVIKRGDSKRAQDMVLMLARFFRLNLSEGKNEILVSQVAEIIRSYLWLMKARYGERLKTDIVIADDILDCYVIKYLFQPIVENAIEHGLESKDGPGQLSILFERREDYLYFEVKDDGIGMSPEKLDDLRNNLKQSNKAEGRNFALKNINEQIKIMYGEQFQISIDSMEGQGTVVSFYIPVRKEHSENDNE